MGATTAIPRGAHHGRRTPWLRRLVIQTLVSQALLAPTLVIHAASLRPTPQSANGDYQRGHELSWFSVHDTGPKVHSRPLRPRNRAIVRERCNCASAAP